MRTEHLGNRPVIDPAAVIAPTAIVSGDVHVGAGSVILAGAVVTSQGAPVRIGQRCIVMEHAVLRGAGRYPCTLGNHVLVGPHAHIAGATINGRSFVATGASVFNGFTKAVFGFESQGLADAGTIEKLCDRYARSLQTHRDDRIVNG